MSDTAFVIDRHFDAPPALVWRAFTEKDLLARWYGPGVETVIHELDVRPGGVWKNEMRFGAQSSFERMDYTEVAPESRLVWEHFTTGPDWRPIPNPMVPGWPPVAVAPGSKPFPGAGTMSPPFWPMHATTCASCVTRSSGLLSAWCLSKTKAN